MQFITIELKRVCSLCTNYITKKQELMNKELLLYFFDENWILFAGVLLASIMTYTSFISSRFSSLSPERAVRFINDGALVIDTRDAEQFRKEHIDGSSHIPSAKIKDDLPSLFSKKKPADILLYCLNGTQSIAVIKKLKPLALQTNYHYIQGGINAWKDAQYPVTKESKKTLKNKKR